MGQDERIVERRCWCGSSKARVVYRFRYHGKPLQYVRCEDCNVLAQWPQVDDETLAAAYDPSYYGSARTKFVGPIAKFVGRFQRKRAEAVAASISRHGPSARVLDIGCGNGGFLSALGELGIKNLEGTEYSEAAARRVAPRAGIKVHVGDLLDLNLPPKHYAAITMWHVLEHVRDPHATLLRCKEILKPGGQIHIALPNQDSNQARRFGKHWFHLDPPRHLHGFGPTSMVRLLRRSGFNMVDLNTFSFEQDPYGWIQSLLNTKGFPRDRAYATLKRVGKHGNAERLTDLALVALLVPYGVAAAVLSPLVDRGGTLTLVAQKD